jgi:hypothetical protein
VWYSVGVVVGRGYVESGDLLSGIRSTVCPSASLGARDSMACFLLIKKSLHAALCVCVCRSQIIIFGKRNY